MSSRLAVFETFCYRKHVLCFYFRNCANKFMLFGLSNYLVPYCEQYIHEAMTDNALCRGFNVLYMKQYNSISYVLCWTPWHFVFSLYKSKNNNLFHSRNSRNSLPTILVDKEMEQQPHINYLMHGGAMKWYIYIRRTEG